MAALAGAMTVGNPADAAPPDTTLRVEETDERKRLESELKDLLDKDPDAFIERAKQLGKKVPFISLLQARLRAPLLVLNNLDHFQLAAHSEAILITSMIEGMDVISAATWLSAHPKKLERMKKDAEYWLKISPKLDYSMKNYKELASFPSPAAAELMLSFYLKHGGKAVNWTDTTDRVGDFEMATRLLDKYPSIRERANAASGDFNKNSFAKTARDLVHAERALLRSASGDIYNFSKQLDKEGDEIARTTLGWAQKHNAQNPLLLAKYAVLVARDMTTRGVASDSVEEVQRSLDRVEAGQREAQRMDILRNRDLFVFISGDSDVEVKKEFVPIYEEMDGPLDFIFPKRKVLKKVETRVLEKRRAHQVHDRNAAEVYERAWKEKNPAGFRMETLAVPFDADGKVADADVVKTKQTLLEYLGSAGNPRVVIIEAHGAKEKIGIYKDPVQMTGGTHQSISPEEFVAAHKKRLQNADVSKNYQSNQRDVYLFTQCLSSDFALNVFALMQKEKLPIPIIVASAETGASSQFLPPSAKPGGEAHFTTALARRLDKGLNKVVEQALTFTPDGIDSPIVIFIPDAEGRPLQVTEPIHTKKEVDQA